MKNKQDVSRREFIKNSMLAGGAMLLSGVLPVKAATLPYRNAENPAYFENSDDKQIADDELLQGVSDIHLHAAPDSKARLGNELEFARAARPNAASLPQTSVRWECHTRSKVCVAVSWRCSETD